MYAVVKASGRQYRLSPGDRVSVEKLEGNPGSALNLSEVLMVGGDKLLIGNPLVKDAHVKCVIEEQFRGPKVLVYKKKRRHKYRKMRGHRSELTKLFVSEIVSELGTFKAETQPHVIDRSKPRVKHEASAEKKAAAPKGEKKAASKKKAPGKSKSKKPATKKR